MAVQPARWSSTADAISRCAPPVSAAHGARSRCRCNRLVGVVSGGCSLGALKTESPINHPGIELLYDREHQPHLLRGQWRVWIP